MTCNYCEKKLCFYIHYIERTPYSSQITYDIYLEYPKEANIIPYNIIFLITDNYEFNYDIYTFCSNECYNKLKNKILCILGQITNGLTIYNIKNIDEKIKKSLLKIENNDELIDLYNKDKQLFIDRLFETGDMMIDNICDDGENIVNILDFICELSYDIKQCYIKEKFRNARDIFNLEKIKNFILQKVVWNPKSKYIRNRISTF
jgi:hypothetical protein